MIGPKPPFDGWPVAASQLPRSRHSSRPQNSGRPDVRGAQVADMLVRHFGTEAADGPGPPRTFPRRVNAAVRLSSRGRLNAHRIYAPLPSLNSLDFSDVAKDMTYAPPLRTSKLR